VSAATLVEHEGDVIGEHEFVGVVSPRHRIASGPDLDAPPERPNDADVVSAGGARFALMEAG
jgi:hypothetical protein